MQVISDFATPKQSAAAGNSFSDEALWSSFKTGNELALSILYKKHVQRLYDYGMHSFRDHDLVVDCLQELFLRLWNKRDTLATVHAVKPYLFKAFRRILLHQFTEQRKKSSLTNSAIAFEFLPSTESTLIEDEMKSEQLQRLKQCVQSLSKGQREVIYLKFFSGLSYPEIAEITEMQVDSVYNLVSKTIELLRRKLQVTKPLVSFP
jgi:RNA polymerase sigma factor (sigma-70 family)